MDHKKEKPRKKEQETSNQPLCLSHIHVVEKGEIYLYPLKFCGGPKEQTEIRHSQEKNL